MFNQAEKWEFFLLSMVKVLGEIPESSVAFGQLSPLYKEGKITIQHKGGTSAWMVSLTDFGKARYDFLKEKIG